MPLTDQAIDKSSLDESQAPPLGRRLPILLGIGIAILIAVSGSTVWLVDLAERGASLVTHTLEVENELQTLLRHIRRAESGERGFVITGDPVDAASSRQGSRDARQMLAALREHTADNPTQTVAIDRLKPFLEARLTDIESVLMQGPSIDRDQLLAIIARGRPMTAQISVTAEAMLATERQLLSSRTDSFHRTSRLLLAASVGGVALVCLLGLIAALQVLRSTQSIVAARQAVMLANEGLEATVAERTSELTESNEEIQRFAYIVSHDLRAPLVNVMGFTSELDALKDDLIAVGGKPADHPDRARLVADFDESIVFIKAAIDRMEGLIAAILRLSREGRRTFRPEPIDTTQLCERLADAQRHQADAAGATVVVEKGLPTFVADRVALEQIFGNLIDNAIKYLDPARPGHIEITGLTVGNRARISVGDNGRGIAEHDHKRVFELFRRSGEQNRPGDGIGLAHVQTLVRSLGGRITLASKLGEGTTFTVVLPLASKAIAPNPRA